MASFAQYLNLIKHIQNWPLYFKRKFKNQNAPVQFITKGIPVEFEVPRKMYGVFKEIFLQDFYKIDNLLKFLPEKAVILDVGANVGYFSMIILSKIKEVKIFAFEPVEHNYSLFLKNIELNKNVSQQVLLIKKVLTGSITGKVDLHMDNSINNNAAVASIYKDFSSQNTHLQQSDAVSLTEFLQSKNIESVDLLKLDCEGSEYPILYETPAYVLNKVKALAIEVHNLDEETRNLRTLVSFLKGRNYSTQFIRENTCYSLFAHKV